MLIFKIKGLIDLIDRLTTWPETDPQTILYKKQHLNLMLKAVTNGNTWNSMKNLSLKAVGRHGKGTREITGFMLL